MKRWVTDRHGRDSLRIDEVPSPTPAAGEVLVRLSAMALSARDPLMIDHGMSLTLDFPFVPLPTWLGWSKRRAAGSPVSRQVIG